MKEKFDILKGPYKSNVMTKGGQKRSVFSFGHREGAVRSYITFSEFTERSFSLMFLF